MRLASRFSSRPTPTTARPDGVAVMPVGRRRSSSRISFDHDRPLLERRRAGAEDEVHRGAVRGRSIDCWMSARRDVVRGLARPRRSARPARRPGTSMRSLTVVDDARGGEQHPRAARSSCSRVKSSTNVDDLVGEHVVGLHEDAELARRARSRPRACARSLMVCESWLTHWIGSVWSMSLSSTRMPPTKITTLATISERRQPTPAGCPSYTTSRPREPSRKSVPLVGDLYSRMPRMASGTMICTRQIDGDADREQQAEVADHRHLGEAQRGEGEDGVERDDEQRRAEVAGGLLDRVRRRGR